MIFELELELGWEVKDVITGFKGIIVGRAQYITGCNQYCIQPIDKKKTAEKKDSIWFDENRLETVKEQDLKLVQHSGDEEVKGGPVNNQAPSI